MNRYEFGNRLCELRRAHGYTQQKLGKMLGVSNKAVSKWENGESMPRLQMLDKIAECFDLSVDELLSYGDVLHTEADNQKDFIEPETEAITSSKITMKLLMDFGWIKIDEKSVINEIKTRHGISNKELAVFIGTSERKIGLWENGIERPSPKYCIILAAFYRLNCEEGDRMNAFFDVRHDMGKEINILKAGTIIIFALVLFSYIFFSVTDKTMYYMDFETAPPLSFNDLLIVALPLASLFVAMFLFSVDMERNRPNIAPAMHWLRIFEAGMLVYLFVVELVFGLGELPLLTLGFLSASYLLMLILLRINMKDRIWNCLVVIWTAVIGIIIAELGVVLMDTIDYNCSHCLYMLVMAMLVLLIGEELLLSGIMKFSEKLKVYFPLPEKEYIPLSKKDVLKLLPVIPGLLCLFVIIEIASNKACAPLTDMIDSLFEKIDAFFMAP